MGKLSKAFAASSLLALTSCVTTPVPTGEPGHRPRPLTEGEIAMAQKIFGNQINYSAISLYSQPGKTSKSFYGRMQMASKFYSDDYSKESSAFFKAVFMHELTHAWQEQRGVDLIGSAIGEWFKHGGKYSKAYKYTLTANLNFNALGIEQQASIIGDYTRRVNSLASWNRDEKCKEILRYETVLKPTFPAIQTPALCRSPEAS